MKLDKKTMFYGLVATILLQFAVLVTEYGVSVYPLIYGQEIRLRVSLFDPRSLFRGNYVRLTYEITDFNFDDLNENLRKLRKNEKVYVMLKQDEAGMFIANGVRLTKPEEGLFIRGRNIFGLGRHGFKVRYGIEAFFAEKDRALELEKMFDSNDGVAVVMLGKHGKAALKDILFTSQ